MRIRSGRGGTFRCAGLIILSLGALAELAQGGISTVVVRLVATNASGTGQIEVRFNEGNWDPQTGDFSWIQSTPRPITASAGGATIATLRSATLQIIDEHRINANFSLQAGTSLTRFDILTAELFFATIPSSESRGRASAAFGISDTNGDGATLLSTGGVGSGCYHARYNGLLPAGATFSVLVDHVTVGPWATGQGFQTDPAFGFRAMNAAIDSTHATMSFTATHADIVNITTTYEVTADGDVPPVLQPPGCDPKDIATAESGSEHLLFKRSPSLLVLAELASSVLDATVSDVELVDVSGDGRKDLIVAWYATFGDGVPTNLRKLTIFTGKGTSFIRRADIDLYILDPQYVALSVFRNGTSEIASGDFDGDGDVDLAVMSFFGDEVWFVENIGLTQFMPHLKHMFGFPSASNFLTPPEAATGDFDGDGSDELVYVADPIQHIEGRMLHFWRTDSTIANMERVDWEGLDGGFFTQWTRALEVADFDGDGTLDLCFTGTINPPFETNPILTFWSNLNPQTGRFVVHNEFPASVVGDVVAVPRPGHTLPDVVLTNIDGDRLENWFNVSSTTGLQFDCAGVLNGYAGLGVNRGMSTVVTDCNRDGQPDLVTKQRLGGRYDVQQIQVSLGRSDAGWELPELPPISTLGLENAESNEIMRPRNLAVADLFGNGLPEVVGGFALTPPTSPYGMPGIQVLQVAYWPNSCIGDVNLDGVTDERDIDVVMTAFQYCTGHPAFNPDADVNKDGCVNFADLAIVEDDDACTAAEVFIADLDCDGILTFQDIDPFLEALVDPSGYDADHPECTRENADINRDAVIDFFDIEGFARVLVGG